MLKICNFYPYFSAGCSGTQLFDNWEPLVRAAWGAVCSLQQVILLTITEWVSINCWKKEKNCQKKKCAWIYIISRKNSKPIEYNIERHYCEKGKIYHRPRMRFFFYIKNKTLLLSKIIMKMLYMQSFHSWIIINICLGKLMSLEN